MSEADAEDGPTGAAAGLPITTMQQYIKIMPDFPRTCRWAGCNAETPTMNELVKHLINEHVNTLNWGNKHDRTHCVCRWEECTNKRVFTYEGRMLEHLRVHTLERPYLCPFRGCNSFFTLKSNCVSHIRSRHRKEVEPIHIDFMMEPGYEFHELAPKHGPSDALFDPFIDEDRPAEKDYYHASSASMMSALPRASRLRDGAADYYSFDLNDAESFEGPAPASEFDEKRARDGDFRLPVSSRLRLRRRGGDTVISPSIDTKAVSTAKAKAVANIPRLPNGQFAPRVGGSPRQCEAPPSLPRKRKPTKGSESVAPATLTISSNTVQRAAAPVTKSSEVRSKTLTDIGNWERQVGDYERQMAQLRRVSRDVYATQQNLNRFDAESSLENVSDSSSQARSAANIMALLNSSPSNTDGITSASQASGMDKCSSICTTSPQPQRHEQDLFPTSQTVVKVSTDMLRTESISILADLAALISEHQNAQSFIRESVIPCLKRKVDKEDDGAHDGRDSECHDKNNKKSGVINMASSASLAGVEMGIDTSVIDASIEENQESTPSPTQSQSSSSCSSSSSYDEVSTPPRKRERTMPSDDAASFPFGIVLPPPAANDRSRNSGLQTLPPSHNSNVDVYGAPPTPLSLFSSPTRFTAENACARQRDDSSLSDVGVRYASDSL
ncbi:hypothetical protein SeMB42_g02435 [Synchytrium endobioticum]|uniref:C2H2-type domain-containing protein n=1 Tax=Synchytrium endobioticum TaxID=286115 RepID=A0A507DED4_9FUNG|nr:hypothetical protein SeLEV6574_g05745 [Synchytrium endobioticum]TPX49896.1 hypothetical protein SeMB42_g02435 [Synchytrium endobioticum]